MRIFKDQSSGMNVLTAELPDAFTVNVNSQMLQFPDNQKWIIQLQANRENCQINYSSGDTFIYEKKRVQMPFGFAQQNQLGSQSPTGAYYAIPKTLQEELDSMASRLFNKQVTAKAYYDLSDNMKSRIQEAYNKTMKWFYDDLQFTMSISPTSINCIIRNYLFDGGIGIYEEDGKIGVVCLNRNGVEMDTCIGQNQFFENITGEPFGQANSMQADTSLASWTIPYYITMISDKPEDLKVFMEFVDTLDSTQETKNYADQLDMQIRQFQRQKAQMENMQNQAMWNNLFAQQHQRFAAMDRLSNQLSRNMDEWRAGQTQMREQLDARLTPSNTQFETSDDRIQRWRHEAMMGVETYDRGDGTTVEFDNNAERVFENNLDSTSHFGTHNYFDNYVPDGWHELKPKN
mgnify:CR=1 FL=1